MSTGNLPTDGKALWEKVYDKALKGSCKGDKECAARTAWSAVKGAGWVKDSSGNWHKKSIATEFSLAISKASFDKTKQRMNFLAVGSDTDEDSFKDNMTMTLFSDFINRIQSVELPPESYRSTFWKGGLPYLSMSHYPDLEGKAVPGVIEAVYIDGNRLKAKGYFLDTPLGRACFNSVCRDLYSENPNPDGPIRISIAFLDYSHKHKSNGFVFTRSEDEPICMECVREFLSNSNDGKEFLLGHLIHLALTRVPVNQRTSLEVRSMSIKTRKDDAISIVGEDDELKSLVEDIDKEAKMIGKSELVIKSEAEEIPDSDLVEESDHLMDGEDECPEGDIECEKKKEEMMKQNALVEEAKTKTVGGESYPASDFLVVEDASEPSTWHLQVKKHGKPDHGLMGAAKAALTSPGGHRGNKYGGPNKEEAIRKLKALYKAEGMDWGDEEKKSEVSEEQEMAEFDLSPVITEIQSLRSMIEGMQKQPEVHPLDGFIGQLKAAYDEIIQLPASADDKLRSLQEPFNAFSQAMIEQVRSSVPVDKQEIAPESKEISVEAITEKVMSNIAPELAEIKAMLKGQVQPTMIQSQGAPEDINALVHRRSLLPSEAKPQKTVQNNTGVVQSILDLADRTTRPVR